MRLTQILSLLFAAIAALVFYYFISSAQKPEVKQPLKPIKIATTEVLVSSQAFEPGDVVNTALVKWIEWPKNLVTPDLFVKGKDTPASLKSHVSLYKVGVNEPLRRYYFTSKKEGGTLSLTLAPNKKAFTLLIGSFANPDTHLAVGDRIDLVSAKVDKSKSSAPAAMRAVKIISAQLGVVQAGAKPTGTVPTSLTFEVSEEQATQLAEMAQAGAIYISHTSTFAGEKLSPSEIAKEQSEVGVEPKEKEEKEEITIIRGEFGG